MSLNEKIESVVKLERLYFDRINFWRSGDKIPQQDLKLNFSKSYRFNEPHDSCIVCLGCNLHDNEDEVFKLEISVTGIFSCNESDSARRDILLKKNTLAILFPYIRSQISIVTAQPGMEPVVLPPMNIDAIFAESKEK